MNCKLNHTEIVKLIHLYRTHDILWDVNRKDFRRKDLRWQAYEEIASEMNMDTEVVKSKIRSLRATYTGEKRKMCMGTSGDKTYVTSLAWFNEMSFLNNSIISRLSNAHANEVRLDKNKVQHARANIKKCYATQEIASTSTGCFEYLEDKSTDNFYDINTQDSNDSFVRTSTIPKSPSTLIIKQERLQEVTVKDAIATDEQEETYNYDQEIIEDDDTETFTQNPPHEIFQTDDTFLESSAMSRKNKRSYISDPLNESDVFHTNRENYHQRHKKKKIARDVISDEPTPPTNNFEQWARKKKYLLEIEYLEMRNYKFKLELYEKEQELQLMTSSKFTKYFRSSR